MYIYVYIYIYREREREPWQQNNTSLVNPTKGRHGNAGRQGWYTVFVIIQYNISYQIV